MPQPVQLHAQPPQQNPTDPVEIPEVLLISALLDTGAFTPGAYRITDSEIGAFTRVWSFCVSHQEIAHAAPAVDLVMRRFPDFPYVPDVNPAWAAQQVHEAAYGRDVRRGMAAAHKLLTAGDYEGVVEEITPLTRRLQITGLSGVASTDHVNADNNPTLPGITVPFARLMDLTMGIRPEELWLLAARFSVGKSWIATLYAAYAAEYGCNVNILSTEMPAWKVNRRINLHHARHDQQLINMLRSADYDQRIAGLDKVASFVPGKCRVFDMKETQPHVGVVEEISDGAHLVLIDHVGHLKNDKGVRAVDDWRVMAGISNSLMDTKNTTGTSIFGVVQINREGDTTGWATPKPSKLNQADQLGQDADVIITMARPNKGRLLIHDCGKNRDNPEGRTYSRFDPAAVDFEEVTREQAQAIVAADIENNQFTT